MERAGAQGAGEGSAGAQAGDDEAAGRSGEGARGKDQPAAAGGAVGEEGSRGKVGEQEGSFAAGFFEQEGFGEGFAEQEDAGSEEEEEILGLFASDAVGVPRALLPRVRVHHRRRVSDSFRAGGTTTTTPSTSCECSVFPFVLLLPASGIPGASTNRRM